MTSPLPPSIDPGPVPADDAPRFPAVKVVTLMAGMVWTDPNGTEIVQPHDVVQLQLHDTTTGEVLAAFMQSPESTIALARTMQSAAVDIINARVDDGGKKAPLSQRLREVDAAFRDSKRR